MQALIDYEWPGNVRQLEHTIERAVIVARGGIITSQHLNLEAAAEVAIVDLNHKLQSGQSLPEVVAEVERLMVGAHWTAPKEIDTTPRSCLASILPLWISGSRSTAWRPECRPATLHG